MMNCWWWKMLAAFLLGWDDDRLTSGLVFAETLQGCCCHCCFDLSYGRTWSHLAGINAS
jgi:hypothetical protein